MSCMVRGVVETRLHAELDDEIPVRVFRMGTDEVTKDNSEGFKS